MLDINGWNHIYTVSVESNGKSIFAVTIKNVGIWEAGGARDLSISWSVGMDGDIQAVRDCL